VEYQLEGKSVTGFPAEIELIERVKVRHRKIPGWQQPTFGIKHFEKLPVKAQDYLNFLAQQVGVPIVMVSTGPERDQTIWMEQPQAVSVLAGS
jgi:adenylosuccinate synthase